MKILFATAAVVAVSASYADNPLSAVMSQLADLRGKIVKEGEAEAKAYKEFFAWCDDAAANKRFEIKTATAKKEDLAATIEKAASEIEEAGTKIEELAASIAKADADLAAAQSVRDKERAEFQAAEGELVQTVDALDRAIAIIGREMAKNPAAFAQMDVSNADKLVKSLTAVLDAASFSTSDQAKLTALVQNQQEDSDDDDLTGAPAAAGYKSHSGGIMDVLEDLKEKAESELADLRKAETSAKHNFEMTKQSLVDQNAADNKDLADEKSSKASNEELKATAEGDLSNTVKDLADANSALETATTDCMTVAADHQATVQSRNEELAALDKARQILEETSSGAAAQTYSFFQSFSLSETRSKLRTRADLANAEVVTAVKRLARQQHSAALAQLANRIEAVVRYGAAAGEDPFTKIKGMIADMIAKLEKEAESDATEKAYCDDEMAKTEAKKAELEDDMQALTSKIDQAASKSAQLKADVKELQAELAKLARSQADMDRIRGEENADYVQTKKDLELGLSGVGKALSVLRDYYGGAAAFVQGDALSNFMQQPAAPEHHSAAGGAGQSIIGMLEVVESDFSKNLASAETEEADAQATYEKTSQENKVTKTLKEQDVKYNTQEYKSLDKQLTDLNSDHATTGSEQSAVLDYYSKLKDRCVAKPESYAERKARRAAEIAGLKEALNILENETAFVQRKKHVHGHAFLG